MQPPVQVTRSNGWMERNWKWFVRGEGRVYVVASKRAGRWKVDLLEVEIDGRAERIDLLRDRAAQTETNP